MQQSAHGPCGSHSVGLRTKIQTHNGADCFALTTLGAQSPAPWRCLDQTERDFMIGSIWVRVPAAFGLVAQLVEPPTLFNASSI